MRYLEGGGDVLGRVPDAAGGGGRGGAGRVGVGGVAEVGEGLAVDHGALRGVHVPREPENVGTLLNVEV